MVESESEAKEKLPSAIKNFDYSKTRKIEDVGSNNNSTNSSGGAPVGAVIHKQGSAGKSAS